MIRHLFTLIWNRKRANFLLITEIFFAFVVLFVVGSLLVYNQRNYAAPLGFDYENVWEVALDPGLQPTSAQPVTYRQIVERLKTLPGVRAVTRTAGNTPFSFNDSSTELDVEGGASTGTDRYSVGREMRDVMNIALLEGRWFGRQDEGAAKLPMVISREVRDKLFPGQKAVGKTIHNRGNDKLYQVVGVTDTYRARSDFAAPDPAVFVHLTDTDTTFTGQSSLLVRVQPGTTAELEKRIADEVVRLGQGWTLSITPLPEQRATKLKVILVPLVGALLVCVFLIVNVALGLFGVLWYNINQRRSEIGLRRALGASSGAISGQFLGEVMVVTTFGLLLGLLVAAQFPLLGVLGVETGVYLAAMLLATGLIYLLTALCALYPSRLAAGIHPAIALREE